MRINLPLHLEWEENSPNHDSHLEPRKRSAGVSHLSRSTFDYVATGLQPSRIPVHGKGLGEGRVEDNLEPHQSRKRFFAQSRQRQRP